MSKLDFMLVFGRVQVPCKATGRLILTVMAMLHDPNELVVRLMAYEAEVSRRPNTLMNSGLNLETFKCLTTSALLSPVKVMHLLL